MRAATCRPRPCPAPPAADWSDAHFSSFYRSCSQASGWGAGGPPLQLASNCPGRQRPVELRNIAEAAGVHFIHEHSSTPEKYYVESAAGRPRRLRLQRRRPARHLLHQRRPARRRSRRAAGAYANRLYRNDGDMRFTDVTDAAGVAGRRLCHGRRRGRLRQRRPRRSLRRRRAARTSCCAIAATAGSRT